MGICMLTSLRFSSNFTYWICILHVRTHTLVLTLIRFLGDPVAVLSSWAGLMDAHSLRDVTPPSWPVGDMELPSRSFAVATFQLSNPHPFVPKQTQQQTTVYPLDHRTVMIPIKESRPFNVTISLQVPLDLGFSPTETLVQFGVLGAPGRGQWKGTADCSTGVKVRPGHAQHVDECTAQAHTYVALLLLPAVLQH